MAFTAIYEHQTRRLRLWILEYFVYEGESITVATIVDGIYIYIQSKMHMQEKECKSMLQTGNKPKIYWARNQIQILFFSKILVFFTQNPGLYFTMANLV